MMVNYVGKRIDDRYEIEEIIGVGGMAVVYKAYDNIDDRTVAVKILKEEYIANEEFRRRFKNESKYIAVLSHPNIVKVYDVSFGDRLQYIVMEHIEGITLKEYIEQQGIIQPKEAIHFTTQILRALQHAHDKGIVHRDVKPQNIILLQNGSIKVTDFGIASFSRSDTRTMSDSAIGSVHYISPEQARGDFTDAKADLYSVGVVMYEMLTGTLPFQSDSAVSVALMQLQNEPVNPSEINKNIPLGLEQITIHAMQKDPKARYQSAAQMLLDIDEFKKNPSIKFDYSYFVDNEPTKFIDRSAINNTKVVPVKEPEYEPEQDNEEDYIDDEQAENNSKLIPILTGAVIGLVAVLVLIFGYLLLFTDTFASSSTKVPDFVDLNYESQILGKKKYEDYKFEVEYEYNPEYDYGVVLRQSPEEGEKLKEGQSILLTVNSNKTVIITDVYGQSYIAAKQTLEAAGFVVTEEFVFDTSVDEGSVISTSPERGDEAPAGSTVVIKISTHTDENAVEVPKIVGYPQDIAEELLLSVGLVIGEVTPQDSTQPAGTVIEQVPEEGEPLYAGDKVDIAVSTGNAPTVAVNMTVRLPYKNGDAGELKVYLNNAAVSDATAEVLLNGSTYSFTVSGSGKEDTLIVKINGSDIYSCKLNFTTDPVAVSNEKTIDDAYYESFYYGKTTTIPDVTGMTRAEATAKLNAKGFYNVTVETQTTLDPSKVGVVMSQRPSISGLDVFKQYSTDTAIVLVVGKGVLG